MVVRLCHLSVISSLLRATLVDARSCSGGKTLDSTRVAMDSDVSLHTNLKVVTQSSALD